MGYRLIGLIRQLDAAAFDDYRRQVGATIEQYGGCVRQRGGIDQVFWNETPAEAPTLYVDIEFPDRATAERWASGPEYRALLAVRRQAMELLLVGLS